MEKQIDINKEVLSKYSDEQFKQWAEDNKLSAADVKEVKASLKKKPAQSTDDTGN